MIILIPNIFLNFSKLKNKTKINPTKRRKNSYKEQTYKKTLYKTDPPNIGILIKKQPQPKTAEFGAQRAPKPPAGAVTRGTWASEVLNLCIY